MSDMIIYPKSPREEIDGISCFVRTCDKIRLFAAGDLHQDYHANLGKGFDLWVCQILNINYPSLVTKVTAGGSDAEVLEWAYEQGEKPEECRLEWWLSYIRNHGCRDERSEVLEKRKVEAGLGGREDILSYFDLIDVEEGRELL